MRKIHATRILISSLLTIFATSCGSPRPALTALGTATVYPEPAGETPSPQYEVRVIDKSGISRRSFVYFDPARQVTTPGNHGTDLQAGRSFSWTTFEVDGAAKVQVVRRGGSFKTVKLRPSRYGLNPETLSGDTIEFVVSPGQKVSVEFDTAMGKCYFNKVDCVRDILMIFADPKTTTTPIAAVSEADVYRPRPGNYVRSAKILDLSAPVVSTLGNAEGKKVVVFGPGVYEIGFWKVPNNVEHIHLEGGAIVYGALDVLPLGPAPKSDEYQQQWRRFTLRPTFKLTGHGILSGRKIPWHMTKDFDYCLDGCWWKEVKLVQLAVTNVTVQDVTLANSPQWAFTFANGADPRTTGVFEGYKVVAQWSYNNDGTKAPARGRIKNCFVQANDDIFILNNSGATIEDCTLWQFGNGAAFQMGWFGKTFSDINVSNIDLIHSETWWGPGDNSGLLNYAKAQSGGGRPGEIRDITFRNIRIEGKTLRLVGLTPQLGQKIRNVRFADVAIESWRHDAGSSERSNYLDGNNGGSIEGVTFENVTVGGEAITAKDAAGLGRLRTSGDVSKIVFSKGGAR
jgi:hypothetical protein